MHPEVTINPYEVTFRTRHSIGSDLVRIRFSDGRPLVTVAREIDGHLMPVPLTIPLEDLLQYVAEAERIQEESGEPP